MVIWLSRHDNEYETWYGHCSRLVSRGLRVAKGELIARINTDRSTGPHLHFEIRKTELHRILYHIPK